MSMLLSKADPAGTLTPTPIMVTYDSKPVATAIIRLASMMSIYSNVHRVCLPVSF